MRTLIVIIVAFLFGKESIAQNFEWARSIGGNSADEGVVIKLDAIGNLYTAGHYESTVDFDPGLGTFNLTAVGSRDIFITKFDTSGNFIWAKSIGGSGNGVINSIAMDDAGNIYSTGYYQGTIDFDPGTGTFNLTSPLMSMFVIKLDSSGNFIWTKSWGTTASSYIAGWSIAIDLAGNLYTTGYFSGGVDFDPGPRTYNQFSVVGPSFFITKLDSSGNFIWVKTASSSPNYGMSIALDSACNLYVAGYYSFNVYFNNITLTTTGFADIFVTKLDSSGNINWIKSMGGSGGNEVAYSIATDPAGNIYIHGYFMNTADFDPGTGNFNLTSAGSHDVYITKLNPSGDFIWAKSFGGKASDIGYSITVDNQANIYTTGYFTDTADFNPDSNTFNLIAFGKTDVFISKLDSSGNFIWAKSFGGNETDIGRSVTLDSKNNIYTTGKFEETVDFNQGIINFNLISAGGADAFIHKMSQCRDYAGIDIVNACDSFTWIDGNTYTANNNTATINLTNLYGCDSIVTLNLTIVYSNTGTDQVIACDSFTWIDGNTYTSSNNSATYTLTNADGCDSVVTLDLTIVYSNSGTDVVSTCNSFTWIDGNTYTSSNNTATHTLTNADGCDSVVTLDLTIVYTNTGVDVVSTCDSFTWIDGVTYTANNNTATHILTNADGCDSVVTLNLTIFYSNSGTDVVSACNSFTWIDGNTYTSSNNTATHILTNANGCDSVVALHLTINSVSDISTTTNATTISANNNSASYRWLDCANNYQFIAGEVSQSFTAAVNGHYAVELTENGCIDTSDCVQINSVGFTGQSFSNQLKVYPNPSSGFLVVAFEQEQQYINLIIRNVLGYVVYENNYASINQIELVLDAMPGIYILELIAKDQKAFVRVVKE